MLEMYKATLEYTKQLKSSGNKFISRELNHFKPNDTVYYAIKGVSKKIKAIALTESGNGYKVINFIDGTCCPLPGECIKASKQSLGKGCVKIEDYIRYLEYRISEESVVIEPQTFNT